jgi:hypothetical protein
MHSVRLYGFCHPAAKKKRERVRFLTGMPLAIQAPQPLPTIPPKPWTCPCCKAPMLLIGSLPRIMRSNSQTRPPPVPD